MEINKTIFDERPEMLVFEGNCIRMNLDVEGIDVKLSEAASEAASGKNAKVREAFAAYVVRIQQPMGYDKAVNAIISAAYPADKMQAIINNHLLDDDDDAEHAKEFQEMQDWRKKAKTWANMAMEEYKNMIK